MHGIPHSVFGVTWVDLPEYTLLELLGVGPLAHEFSSKLHRGNTCIIVQHS
jgi:hypothetical protein